MIRILIVDDHEIVREGLAALLEVEPDLEVVGKSGCADNLMQLVDVTGPDVVLLDARLPGVSGAEACRALTTTHPQISVLIVSTYADESIVDDCIAAGAKGYVIKDIEGFTLKQNIRAVHHGEGAVSPVIAARAFERLRARDLPSMPELTQLSFTQIGILRLVAAGFSNREIGAEIHLSENTVKSHLQEIFRKLNVRTRVEAALHASREGWLDTNR